QFRIDFASQSDGGTYTVTVGPNIADTDGNLMDQDQNGTSGDAFTGTFSIQAIVPFASRYDFGTDTSPLESGYTRVTGSTTYSAALGYGWQSGNIRDRDRGIGNDLDRDVHFMPEGVFAVDLPNGTYTVTARLGDSGPY